MSTATTSESHLRRALGVPSLVFFGLAYMVPLTVFTTYGIVTEETSGHLPMAYVLTLLTMLFTAYSYANMVRAYPTAGSAYTYTQQTLGGGMGFMVGWSLMLDYLFLPMINYLVIGIYMKVQFPEIPAWVWIIAAIIIVTGLNILGIVLVARMNMILIGIQVIFILVFLVMSLKTIGDSKGGMSLIEPFWGENAEISTLAAGAAILCLSFLGFDAVSTLSEEAKKPLISIPRAILLCTFIGGGIYILLSYTGHLVFPDWHNFTDADSAAVDVMLRAGGDFLAVFFTAAYVAGCFASAMASQVSVTRILYAMGRDSVLPGAIFAKLHPKFKTPHITALIVGVVSLIALIITLDLLSALISFGALIAFTFVNVAVIKHYIIDKGERGGKAIVKFAIAPAVGVILCIWLWTSLSGITFVIGLSWAAIGLLYLIGLTRGFRRPAPTMQISDVVEIEEQSQA